MNSVKKLRAFFIHIIKEVKNKMRMELKQFVSANKLYSLSYPSNWKWDVDPESNGKTIRLINQDNSRILRITSLKISGDPKKIGEIDQEYRKRHSKTKINKKQKTRKKVERFIS